MNHYEAEFPLDEIMVGANRRPLEPQAVDRLADSIRILGLRTPLTVRLVEVAESGPEQVVLVAGHHRLEALRQLGFQRARCLVCPEDDETRAELWEISENVHRSELSVLERANHLKRWCELYAQIETYDKSAKAVKDGLDPQVSRQVDAKPRGGRPRSAHYAAGEVLNLSRKQVERLNTVNRLSDEAQAVATELGLENNARALQLAARSKDQAAALKLYASEKSGSKASPAELHQVSTDSHPRSPGSGPVADAGAAAIEIKNVQVLESLCSEDGITVSLPSASNVVSLPTARRFRPRDQVELSYAERTAFNTIRNSFALLETEVQATTLLAVWSECPAEVKEYFLAQLQATNAERAPSCNGHQ